MPHGILPTCEALDIVSAAMPQFAGVEGTHKERLQTGKLFAQSEPATNRRRVAGRKGYQHRCSILVDLVTIRRLFSGLGSTAVLPTVIIPAAASETAAGVQSEAFMRRL